MRTYTGETVDASCYECADGRNGRVYFETFEGTPSYGATCTECGGDAQTTSDWYAPCDLDAPRD